MTTDASRAAIERSFRRRRLALFLSTPLFVILTLLASSHGLISDTTLFLAPFLYVGVATAAYLTLLLKARKKLRAFTPDFTKPPDDEEQKRLRRSIRSLKKVVVFYALALIFGVWTERNEPSVAMLVGVVISLLIQTWLIVTIRGLNRRLNFGAAASIDQRSN